MQCTRVTFLLSIANYGAHNIVRWSLGDSYWTLVAGVTGLPGNSSKQLNSPVGVTLDSMAGQSKGTTVASVTGTSENSANLLNTPFSVALDTQRNLYVADMANSRIQQFI
ncbi:unnamed protein product [Rotaria sp. Silwood1]|nr:unnamed protein product [Rotaria sp. Silwood1]